MGLPPVFELRIVFRDDVLASDEKARAIAKVVLDRGADLAPTVIAVTPESEVPMTIDAVAPALAAAQFGSSASFRSASRWARPNRGADPCRNLRHVSLWQFADECE
jgi:hypothetical protein